jgi:hypothetical protein
MHVCFWSTVNIHELASYFYDISHRLEMKMYLYV